MLPFLYLLKLFPTEEDILWSLVVLLIVGLPTIVLIEHFHSSITLYLIDSQGLSTIVKELAVTILVLSCYTLAIVAAALRRGENT